jgi:hypothetical protein
VVSEARLKGKSSSMCLMARWAARSLLADIKEWTLNMLYIPAAGLKVGVGVV